MVSLNISSAPSAQISSALQFDRYAANDRVVALANGETMKYIRKAIALVLAAVFIAALAIGLSVVFAVRNINVITIDYAVDSDVDGTDEFAEAVSRIEDGLSQFEGKTIITVDEEEIAAVVENSGGYAEFVSCSRIYPCTINVTVRERLEVFAVPVDGGYSVLDGNCEEIALKAENINNIDGSPNVLLENVPADDYSLVTSMCESFGEMFSSVRAFAESVSVASDEIEGDSLLIRLRCGVTMEMRDYKERSVEKAEALFNAFGAAPDYLKLDGVMYCLETDSGAIRVVLSDGTVV